MSSTISYPMSTKTHTRFIIGLIFYVFFSSAWALAQTPKQQAGQLKLIALSPHLVELLYELGAQEHIIATTTSSDYPDDARHILTVGDHSRLQIEKIIQLQPDIILAWKSGNPLDDLSRLESYGLRVEYFDPKVLSDVAADIRRLGELVEKSPLAEILANQFLQRLTQITSRYSKRQAVSVFFEIWPSPLQTVSGGSWPQQQLQACGADNIIQNSTEDYPSISIEQVLTNQPQVIIQPRSERAPASAIFDWTTYPFIPAVKHHFILHPNADKMYRMTRRVLDEIDSLCQSIDQARQFYLSSK
ncbi:helical backbone metal receptor [Aliiglaciecola litoralis]|uniref:Cobalamin-binding protein n=1 Tax=Aliiglaciecola litoralis TaxID=582857 RepID=A0ABN1LE33_9ALTE